LGIEVRMSYGRLTTMKRCQIGSFSTPEECDVYRFEWL
jgi:hypothetical protein